MRTMPKALFLFSLCMMGVAIGLPIQVVYLQDSENMFQTLTLLNIFIMVTSAMTAVAAFKAHKSFRYLLPMTTVAVVFNNWWVGYVGFNFNLLETSAASLSFLVLCSVLLEKNTFKVLANPKLKWWHVPLRSKIEIPVTLAPLRGPALTKKSFDISESGFFLQGLEKEELERLNIGEKFSVCFNFSRIIKVRCAAKVVRKCAENGSYPPGVGLQFEGLSSQIKSAIKNLSRVNNEAAL